MVNMKTCGRENTDLEKENKKLREQLDIMTGFCGACKKGYEDKLARARGVIKKLLSVYFYLILKTEKARIESELYMEASELLMELEEKEIEI